MREIEDIQVSITSSRSKNSHSWASARPLQLILEEFSQLDAFPAHEWIVIFAAARGDRTDRLPQHSFRYAPGHLQPLHPPLPRSFHSGHRRGRFPDMVGGLVERSDDQALVAHPQPAKSISHAFAYQNVAFYQQRPRMDHHMFGKVGIYARDERGGSKWKMYAAAHPEQPRYARPVRPAVIAYNQAGAAMPRQEIGQEAFSAAPISRTTTIEVRNGALMP